MIEPDHGAGVWAARVAASDAAHRAGASAIEPAHLLIALCELCDWDLDEEDELDVGFRDELAAEIAELRLRFAQARADPASLRRRIRRRLDVRGTVEGDGDEPLHRGPAVRVAFERAEALAAADGSARATAGHLLRAVLEAPVPQWEVPARQLGIDDMLAACFPPEPVRPGAPTVARVELEVVTGSVAGRRVVATEPTRWVVGRADDCHLVVPAGEDTSISRHHALVEVDPPHARVRDLGSRNGTRVNGERLRAPAGDRDGADRPDGGGTDPEPVHRDLADGDELALGRTRLRVTTHGPPATGGGRRGPGGTRLMEPDDGPAAAPTVPPAGPAEPPTDVLGPSAPRGPAPDPAALSRCPVCAELFASSDPFGEAAELCRACRGDPDRIVEIIGRRVERGERLPGLFGGYTVYALVGDGGMGRVYRADDEQTGDDVCIKVMLPAGGSDTAVRMFHREAANGRQLRHRHIVRQREHDEWFGVLYLVTDYCEGGDLRDVIERAGGRLDAGRAVRIAIQALDGLQYAHTVAVPVLHADGGWDTATGLVHRDISLGNLLFAGGILKIGDFGLSKAFTHAGLSGITRTGTAAGKPHYLPRRQVNEFRDVGPEVDIWAVAACLYVMLTAQPPRDFSGTAPPFKLVLERPVIPIRQRCPSVRPALAAVVDAALTEDDEPVYRTAKDLRDALEAVLGP